MLLGISPNPFFTLRDAHLFLTWLTDPRSMYYVSANTFCIQCTLDHHRAFVTGMPINQHLSDGQTKELRAAVPVDLLDATCDSYRVWILQPRKCEQGESKWRLIGKALLLGEPDLMGEARMTEGRKDMVLALRKRTVVSG